MSAKIQCVEAWPECVDGDYDPRCCRFPKSCSCGPRSLTPPDDRTLFARLGSSLFSWWKSDTINTERAGHHGEGRWEVADHTDANLISSRLQDQGDCAGGEWHSPVIDIDFPARLVPSATPGHYHLYLDRPMKWEKYEELLFALAKAKIISRHYLKHSVLRQATMARPPWVPKVMVEGGFDSDGDAEVEDVVAP